MTEWIDPRYADLVEALDAALRMQGPGPTGTYAGPRVRRGGA
jgi:hypothetical protein